MKVEVFNSKKNKICRLPDLPGVGRWGHSQCGHLLCGGVDYSTQCLVLNPLTGNFTPTSVRLREKRLYHLCWDVEGENGPNLLMGGDYSGRSTELVSSDGSSSSANFTLKYDTNEACGIKTQDKFVITGGMDISSPDSALKTVTRYSRTGQTESLPQLNVGRWSHACGSYLTDKGDMVLLVTGGAHITGGSWIFLDSTEVLEEKAGTWRLTGPLPSARDGMRAASVANTIFLFGGWNILDNILRYNKNHTWEEVGQMNEERTKIAVAVLEDVSQLCP